MLSFVGCSSASTLPPNLIHATDSVGLSGGALSGGYAGNFSEMGCGLNSGGSLSFSGSGQATFLGMSSESGHMVAGGGACAIWKGSATLTSRFHRANTVTVSTTFTNNDQQPCNNPRHGPGRFPTYWTVTGGTGKFANATGKGSVTLVCDFTKHTYTDTWTGALKY